MYDAALHHATVLLDPELDIEEKRPHLAHYLQDAGLTEDFTDDELKAALETLVQAGSSPQERAALVSVINSIIDPKHHLTAPSGASRQQ